MTMIVRKWKEKSKLSENGSVHAVSPTTGSVSNRLFCTALETGK
jgi:hypothetical protein